MRDNFKTTILTGKAPFTTVAGINMSDNGKMERHMVLGPSLLPPETTMRVNGKMISAMVRVLKNGLMVRNIEVISKMIKNTEMEFCSFLTEENTKENFKMGKYLVEGLLSGLMEETTKVNGAITK